MNLKAKKIIKQTVACIVFITILIVTAAECSYILRYNEDKNATKIIENFYALEENTADIAFVGSSAIYRYIIPTELYSNTSYTSCCFAAPAFPFDATVNVIKEIRKTQNPGLFVIDLRNLYKNICNEQAAQDKEEYNKENMSRYSCIFNNMPLSLERARIISKAIKATSQKYPLDWYFEYLRTHDNWKKLDMEVISDFIKERLLPSVEKENKKDKYFGTTQKKTVQAYEKPNVESFSTVSELTAEQLEPLDSLLDYIDKNELNVLFIFTPYVITEEYYGYEVFLENYVTERGFDCVNFNGSYDEIGFDFERDFYNEKHTNLLGALKFNEYFSNYIREHYNITTKELSAKQELEWEAASQNWYNDVALPGIAEIEELCQGGSAD